TFGVLNLHQSARHPSKMFLDGTQVRVDDLQFTGLTMQFGEHTHFRAKQVRNNWNGNVVDGAALISANAVNIRHVNAGNENDRGVLIPRMLANQIGQLKTVDVRHADVQQNDGDVFLQQMIKSLAPGACLDEVFVQAAQNCLVAQELRRLVVDHQNID